MPLSSVTRATRLMARQAGCAHVRQLRTCGLGRAQIASRIESGSWRDEGVGVVTVAGSAATPEQRIWTAWLAVRFGVRTARTREVAVAGRAAALLLKMGPLPSALKLDVVELLVRFGEVRPKLRGAKVRAARDWDRRRVLNVDGLRVMGRAETIADLAPRLSAAELLALLQNEAWERPAVLGQVAARGGAGVRTTACLRTAVATLRAGVDSSLHQRGVDALVAAGVPKPACGVEVVAGLGEEDCVLRRASATAAPWGIVLGFNGDLHRTKRAKTVHGRRRVRDLGRDGWVFYPYGTEDVARPAGMVAEVLAEWRRQRALPSEGDGSAR